MPIATDVQMQAFADQRIRPFAEAFRGVLAAARDHKSAIDDEYARATQNPGTRWNDNRTDPPHKLQSGFSGTSAANPDDVTNFNAFVSALADMIDGVGTDATNAATLRSTWGVLVDACVRPVLG